MPDSPREREAVVLVATEGWRPHTWGLFFENCSGYKGKNGQNLLVLYPPPFHPFPQPPLSYSDDRISPRRRRETPAKITHSNRLRTLHHLSLSLSLLSPLSFSLRVNFLCVSEPMHYVPTLISISGSEKIICPERRKEKNFAAL